LNFQIENEYRQRPLFALAERFEGLDPLGRHLGFKDGAYVGQMIRGDRPISERFVARVNGMKGLEGWFYPGTTNGGPEFRAADSSIDAESKMAAPINGADIGTSIGALVQQIGCKLMSVDVRRRNAIAPLLGDVAKVPGQATQIAVRIAALLNASASECEVVSDALLSNVLLQIESSTFKHGSNWRVTDGSNSFYAEIRDKKFMERVATDLERLGKWDILVVMLRQIQTITDSGLKTESIIERVIRRYEPLKRRVF
jgi:hypothetical protein